MQEWKRRRWAEIQKDQWRVWKPWFAWHPVKTVSDRWVWWATVYRKVANTYTDDMDMTWFFYGDEFDILKYS